MDYKIELILIASGISLVLTGIIIPQVLLIAFRKQLFDVNDSRKIHKGFVPRLGGTAFLPALLCSMTFTMGFAIKMGNVDHFLVEGASMQPLLFAFCTFLLLYLVGLADDLVGVRYRAKFINQIICAFILILGGLEVTDFHGVLWIHEIPSWISWFVTVFVVVAIVNAINLIDGIDGLASGLSGLALAFYGTVFFLGDEFVFSMLAWTMCGALVTFFYYNVFGNAKRQKKIFMGDTGSLTVGMVLAFLAIEMNGHSAPSSLPAYNPIVMAFAPLIVPLFDVVRVTLHRIRAHRNPFLPDRAHIHHKFLALGFSSRAAMGMILSVALFFILSNVLLSARVNVNIILGGDILVWSLGNTLLTKLIHRREKKLGVKLYE